MELDLYSLFLLMNYFLISFSNELLCSENSELSCFVDEYCSIQSECKQIISDKSSKLKALIKQLPLIEEIDMSVRNGQLGLSNANFEVLSEIDKSFWLSPVIVDNELELYFDYLYRHANNYYFQSSTLIDSTIFSLFSINLQVEYLANISISQVNQELDNGIKLYCIQYLMSNQPPKILTKLIDSKLFSIYFLNPNENNKSIEASPYNVSFPILNSDQSNIAMGLIVQQWRFINITDSFFIYDSSMHITNISKYLPFSYKFPVNITDSQLSTYFQLKLSKGADIFNATDPFLNDICMRYIIGYADITINNRRKMFNTTISCNPGCYYTGVDENKYANCYCYSSDYQNATIIANIHGSFLDSVSEINFDVILCFQNAFDPELLYQNIGFWTSNSLTILTVTLILYFNLSKINFIEVNIDKIVYSDAKFISEDEDQSKEEKQEKPAEKNNENNPILNRKVEDEAKIQVENEFNLNAAKVYVTVISEKNPEKLSSMQLQINNFIKSTDGHKIDNYANYPPTLTLKDYDSLSTKEKLTIDHRSACSYLGDSFKFSNPILSLFFKKSLMEPFEIRVSYMAFKITSQFALNALLFSEKLIDSRADTVMSSNNDPSSVGFWYTLTYEYSKSIICTVISVVLMFVGEFLLKVPQNIEKEFNTVLLTRNAKIVSDYK